MAATIARCRGYSKNGTQQSAEATRLGHGSAEANANTFHTFARVTTNADGSGQVHIEQNRSTILNAEWPSESEHSLSRPRVIIRYANAALAHDQHNLPRLNNNDTLDPPPISKRELNNTKPRKAKR